ncbi:small nuclear ribonucleoprotein [Rhizoctonia solani]|uniref:Nucleolar protein 58 n=1 Tax=Rhizoctonia solani TaxID=456999 RepID=A0A8H8NPL1_9AGAM|nr:small nuclear ribonucleoprotein [Rhizoctonia solani]QRW15992.1 small nuclear ribonucleoprotein [Rhizoctonia solani]
MDYDPARINELLAQLQNSTAFQSVVTSNNPSSSSQTPSLPTDEVSVPAQARVSPPVPGSTVFDLYLDLILERLRGPPTLDLKFMNVQQALPHISKLTQRVEVRDKLKKEVQNQLEQSLYASQQDVMRKHEQRVTFAKNKYVALYISDRCRLKCLVERASIVGVSLSDKDIRIEAQGHTPFYINCHGSRRYFGNARRKAFQRSEAIPARSGCGQRQGKESLAVIEPKLGGAIAKKLGIQVVSGESTQDLFRGIRSQLSSLLDGLDPTDLSTMSLGLSHSLSRFKLKFSPDKVDIMVIQAIALLDDLDKEINIYSMRVKLSDPECCPGMVRLALPRNGKIIVDNLAYAKVVREMGFRTNAATTSLASILPEELELTLKAAAEISMGTEISDSDISHIHSLCDQVISISAYRAQLSEYLRNRMNAIAPNLTALVGELVGARLISHAGSLMSLAKHPASTVQILGAEKALFRALKTKHDTPKYGLIYHASLIGQAPQKLKGKMARMVATKARSIRVDALADVDEKSEATAATIGIENRAKLESRLRALEHQSDLGSLPFANTVRKQSKFEMSGSTKQYNTAADSVGADQCEGREEKGKEEKKKAKAEKKAKKEAKKAEEEAARLKKEAKKAAAAAVAEVAAEMAEEAAPVVSNGSEKKQKKRRVDEGESPEKKLNNTKIEPVGVAHPKGQVRSASNEMDSQRPPKRSRKAINCDPCRRATLCYPDSGPAEHGQPAQMNGNEAVHDNHAGAGDPYAEIARMRQSLATLESLLTRHGISPQGSSLGSTPSPDGLMTESTAYPAMEVGMYVGPTSAASPLLSFR